MPSIFAYATPAFSYVKVRQDIVDVRKSRGFPPPGTTAPGKGKGKGRMNHVSIEQIKMRTRFARCGQIGHWAGVPEPPEAGWFGDHGLARLGVAVWRSCQQQRAGGCRAPFSSAARSATASPSSSARSTRR